jgi:hypothetical protein
VNIRSLNTGFEELCSVIDDFRFDFLGITESWLTSEIPSHMFEIPGYFIHRCDRPIDLGEGGGGVVLFVKDEIKFSRVYLHNVDKRIEYVGGVVHLKGLSFLLCTAYRPPDVPYSTLSSLVHALFIDMSPDVDLVILLGDLNVNLLDKKRADVRYLERIFNSLGLAQLIKDPTRITENTSSLIDLIVVDKMHSFDVGMVNTSNILQENGRSITDHTLAYCDVPYKKPINKGKFISYRSFKDFNCSTFINIASNIPWADILKKENVDEITDTLTSNIAYVFDVCAPMVRKRITREKSPWRDHIVEQLTKEKNKCKKSYLNLKTQVSRNAYCKARNALNKAIRTAKRQYFTDNLKPNNPKTFWATLRVGGVLRSCEVTDHSVGLEELNTYFSTMGCGRKVCEDKLRFFSSNKCEGVTSSFGFTPVSDAKVKELMNNITSTAFGIDGLSIKMIRGLSPYCISAIAHLINVSLKNGHFPSSWKQSVVIPLQKTSNPSLASDFRPISILPVMSKILEKVVCEQLVSFLESEGLLPETQSGFRKGFSTCTALLNVLDEIISARDRGLESLMTALDFSQAFDSVSFDLLIAKLHFYNFDETAIRWFSSYLTGRSQRTKVNGQLSAILPRSVGVPQGSCLGPILFLLYTADLKDEINFCSLHSYADDSQLLMTFKPAEAAEAVRCVNSDLAKVKRWSDDHGLLLNPAKCSVLRIDLLSSRGQKGDGSVERSILVDGKPLTSGNTLKVLGVTLDSHLDFSSHVNSICKTIIIRLRTLLRFSTILPQSSKLEIIRSTIFPIIQYALPAFSSCLTRENELVLTRLQNRALRFVYNLRKFDHISEFRLSAKVLSIVNLSDMQTVKVVHKVLESGKPEYLRKKLVFRQQISVRNTRQDCLLHLPKTKLECGKKAFRYFGPQKYNALPLMLRNSSYPRLKKYLKDFVTL